MAEQALDIVFSTAALGTLTASRDLQESRTARQVSISLALSTGDISEDLPGPRREATLVALTAPADGPRQAVSRARELMDKARTSLEEILEQARRGGPLRVWYSLSPDEFCPLCWLMTRLEPFGQLDLTAICLPLYHQRPDGVVVTYIGWGEVDPELWKDLALSGEQVSPNLRRAWAMAWRELQRENAPLRTVINRRLVSVEEDFYDPFLRRELAAFPREFPEPRLIAALLGKYQLGVADGFWASRIEHLVQTGELEVLIPPPSEDSPTAAPCESGHNPANIATPIRKKP